MFCEKSQCDLCSRERSCDEIDCIFVRMASTKECDLHECWLNYDGICKANLADECGASKFSRINNYRIEKGKNNEG